MPALLINIRIDSGEKLELFKVTFADVACLFGEIHIKIRGSRAQACIDFARGIAGPALCDHQAVRDDDWVAATLEMMGKVGARSVFVFFEDHRLVAPPEAFAETMRAFDEESLDYLCYSFFRASQLESKNLLPLAPITHAQFDCFALNAASRELLGRISPNYYSLSLLCIASVEYFTAALHAENHRRKVYSRLLVSLLTRAFRYPGYRKAHARLNAWIAPLGYAMTLYEPSSPFNLEKLWFESVLGRRDWKFGIPRRELFANYDDDNGSYGESMIKRGLYPLGPDGVFPGEFKSNSATKHTIQMQAGDHYDCTYFSHRDRIRQLPIVRLVVISGEIEVNYRESDISIVGGEQKSFYSNCRPLIRCLKEAALEIHVFDEQFSQD